MLAWLLAVTTLLVSICATPHYQHQQLRKLDAAEFQLPELIPLFQGFGSHYAYVWVGSHPPVRQAVIVDTSSEWTTFPCEGCSNCGDHIDSFYNPSKSTSMVFPNPCPDGTKTVMIEKKENPLLDDPTIGRQRRLKGNKKASAPQDRYCTVASPQMTEGSSWNGNCLQDQMFLGGAAATTSYSKFYNFSTTFACQTNNEGEFRSQMANGVLGLNLGRRSIISQLSSLNVSVSENPSTFSLCLRIGGGIMSYGGATLSLNKRKVPVKYVKAYNNRNAWSVNITSVNFDKRTTDKNESNPSSASVGNKWEVFSGTKGAIINSGSTATYLPLNMAESFKQGFQKVAGFKFPTPYGSSVKLSKAQVDRIPDITFTFQGMGGPAPVTITMPWSAYVSDNSDGSFTFELYPTEKTGTVLGSNFMLNQNVIFDRRKWAIGFGESTCNEEEFIWTDSTETAPPSLAPKDGETSVITDKSGSHCNLQPFTECTALCSLNESYYVGYGEQNYVSSCDGAITSRPCQENCNFYNIVRGDPQCPDHAWTECSHGCITSRRVVPKGESTWKVTGSGKEKTVQCNYVSQTDTCYTGACPYGDGDYLIYLDFRIHLSPAHWTYVHTEAFIVALAKVLSIKSTSLEMLNDAGSEYSYGTKLHIQIRLKDADYKKPPGIVRQKYSSRLRDIHDAAEAIVTTVRSPFFPDQLLLSLDRVATTFDSNSTSRFGWLYKEDVEVLSAIGIPVGGGLRDFEEDGETTGFHGDRPHGLSPEFILGLASLGMVLVVIFVFCMYLRLKKERSLLEKDKGSLREMWKSLNSAAAAAKDKAAETFTFEAKGGANHTNSHLSGLMSREQYEIEMSKLSLLDAVGDDDDLDDVNL